MTGVTALSRGTAARMAANGPTYPAERIRALLRDTDLLHISNEVSFAEASVPAHAYSSPATHATSPFLDTSGEHHRLSGTTTSLSARAGAGDAADLPPPRLALVRRRRDDAEPTGLTLASQGDKARLPRCDPVRPAVRAGRRGPSGRRAATSGHGAPGPPAAGAQLLADRNLPAAGRPTSTRRPGNRSPRLRRDLRRARRCVSGSQAHPGPGFAFDDDRLIHYASATCSSTRSRRGDAPRWSTGTISTRPAPLDPAATPSCSRTARSRRPAPRRARPPAGSLFAATLAHLLETCRRGTYSSSVTCSPRSPGAILVNLVQARWREAVRRAPVPVKLARLEDTRSPRGSPRPGRRDAARPRPR